MIISTKERLLSLVDVFYKKGLMMQSGNMTKTNNKGFTLVEVLIAMVILAIAVVPLARGLATGAYTNRKAKIEAKCTTAAENLAEEIRNVPMDELIDKYSAYYTKVSTSYDVSGRSCDIHTFKIDDNTVLKSDMPDGYCAYVELDPTYYENANLLNLSDVDPISLKNAAIYSMEAGSVESNGVTSYYDKFDRDVYEKYVQMNADNRATSASFSTLTYDDVKEKLIRRITITVDQVGTIEATETTDEVKLIKVALKIDYELENYSQYLTASQYKQTIVDTYIYDNTTSKNPMTAVYLFFYPRYAAGATGSSRDIINVYNLDNVEFNLYLTAMDGADDAVKATAYNSIGGLRVNIFENPDLSAVDKAAISLRTNLNSGAPYSQNDTNTANGKLYMTLKYSNLAGTVNKTGDEAKEILSAANTDGKSLSSSDTPIRIYKMKIGIYSEDYDPTASPAMEPVVEFDGTKLEY